MNDHIESILTVISKNPVTNVVSSTGTGKTTILPVGIAEAGNKITVVVNSEEKAKALNLNIGISNIKYIDSYNMKQQLYKDGFREQSSDILMIDEADAGTMDQALIMLIWRYYAEQKYVVPHLLLVSSSPIKLDSI